MLSGKPPPAFDVQLSMSKGSAENKSHLRLTMNAVKQATKSMLTPMEASTTMAISRLRLLGVLATDTYVELVVVFKSALLVAVIWA